MVVAPSALPLIFAASADSSQPLAAFPPPGTSPPGAGAFAWIRRRRTHVARTVADLRALFAVMTGPDPGDALSAPVPLRDIPATDLRGLRIGILENPESRPPHARDTFGVAPRCTTPVRTELPRRTN